MCVCGASCTVLSFVLVLFCSRIQIHICFCTRPPTCTCFPVYAHACISFPEHSSYKMWHGMLSDTDKMASGCQLLCGHDDRTGHDHDKPSPWSIWIGSVMRETTETDRLHRTEHIIVVLMEYFNIFEHLTNPPRCILGSSWTHVRAQHIWPPRFPQSDALALTYVYRALCTINIYFWWFTELFSLLWGS